MKNYLEHEKMAMHMSLSLKNSDNLNAMSEYQPLNGVVRNLDKLMQPLFIDTDPVPGDNRTHSPVIYEIGSCGVTELCGPQKNLTLSISRLNFLLLIACPDVDDENCILSILFKKFKRFRGNNSRRQSNFVGYMLQILTDSKEEVTIGRTEDVEFMTEVDNLTLLLCKVVQVDECFQIT